MTTEGIRCKNISANDEPCHRFAMADGYCLAHSPDLQEKRVKARARPTGKQVEEESSTSSSNATYFR